ncbi:hypothetical protein AAY473_023182 [Plecturocebus cupreus]
MPQGQATLGFVSRVLEAGLPGPSTLGPGSATSPLHPGSTRALGKTALTFGVSSHGVPQEFWAGGLMAVLEKTPSLSPWGTPEGLAGMCSLWVAMVRVRDLVPVHAEIDVKASSERCQSR